MNEICRHMRDLSADDVSGLLAREQAAELSRHIESCSACREYAAALRNEDAAIVDWLSVVVPADAPLRPALLWRRLAMNRRLRLSLAAAAAVAIVAVLWPGIRDGGKVYGLPEAVEMLQKAKTLHMRTLFYPTPPITIDNQRASLTSECWVDLTGGRCRWNSSKMSTVDGSPLILDPSETLVCNGEHMMRVDHEHRTARFERLFGAQRELLMQYSLMEPSSRVSIQPQQLKSYVKADETQFDGQRYDVYRRQHRLGDTGKEMRDDIWVSPTTGRIGRTQFWNRESARSPWDLTTEIEPVQLDVDMPAGLFALDAPSGYKLENTMQAAPVSAAAGSCNWDGRFKLDVQIAFTLADGSVLASFSPGSESLAREKPGVRGKGEPGGPLPGLQAVLSELTVPSASSGESIRYAGRFVAWTGLSDRAYAWCIYVPERKQPESASVRLYFGVASCQPVADNPRESQRPMAVVSLVVTGEQYTLHMADAMRLLSEDGRVPEALGSYEGLLKLAATIRSRPEYYKVAATQASQPTVIMATPVPVVLPADAARQAQHTVEAFFKAVVDDRGAEARSMLTYDEPRATKVVTTLGALPGFKSAKVDSVYAVDTAALVLTTEFDFPQGQRGSLAVAVICKDQQWRIRDFDFVRPGRADDEIAKFQKAYPEAKRYGRP